MSAPHVPYVRTIILPSRQLTDWEVEMLRAAQNTRRIYGDEIRPAKSMLGDARRGIRRDPYILGKPLHPAILMNGSDARAHLDNEEFLYSVPLTTGDRE